MNFKLLVLLMLLPFVPSCISTEIKNSGTDKNLIIPGEAAEGYKLGEQLLNDNIIKKSGSIGGIISIPLLSDIKFDSVLYNSNTSAVFINNGIIVAIAGFNTDRRITFDAILLSDGIENFILNYGNSELQIIGKNNNHLYCYKKLGIAIFNDNNDNSINMYLIFKK